MSAVLMQTDPMLTLSAAHTALDELHDLDLTGLSEDELLAFWRELERLRRRIPSVEHGLVLEAEARGLPDAHQARGMPGLLRGLLRLDPGEASARVRAAQVVGARRAMTGQLVPPLFPRVAAAQAAGAISERQARVVIEAVEKLPDEVQAEHGDDVEADLVRFAAQFDPVALTKLATRIAAYYDPDGRLTDVAYRDKHRELTVRQRVDGSATLTGECTAELTELLLTHFDALVKPKPEQDGVKDPRTAGQRRHDALLDALKLNLRARQLPTIGGVTATIVLTMTAEQFASRQGLATTGHCALLPVSEAMRIAAGDYRLMNVVIDKTKGITGYSSVQRLFGETQRLAMIAAPAFRTVRSPRPGARPTTRSSTPTADPPTPTTACSAAATTTATRNSKAGEPCGSTAEQPGSRHARSTPNRSPDTTTCTAPNRPSQAGP